MKHLVLGSEGQIGGHLLNYLKKTNEEVVEFNIKRTTAGDLRIYNNEQLTKKIKELVELIVKLTGFEGEIRWDTTARWTAEKMFGCEQGGEGVWVPSKNKF